MRDKWMCTKYRYLAVIAISVVGAYTGSAWGQLSDKFNEAKDFGMVESFEIRETIGEVSLQPLEAPARKQDQAYLWAKWTAPSTGVFAARKLGNLSASATAYRGSHPDYLEPAEVFPPPYQADYVLPFHHSADDPNLLFLLNAEEGSTYHIAFGVATGNEIGFQFAPQQAASNDEFSSPIDLGKEFPLTFSTDLGLATSNEIENALGFRQGLLWWEWEAPETGTYLIRTTTSWDRRNSVVIGRSTETLEQFYILSETEFLESATLEAGEVVRIGAMPSGTTIEIIDGNVPTNSNTSRQTAIDLGESATVAEQNITLTRPSNFQIDRFESWFRWTPTLTGVAQLRMDWTEIESNPHQFELSIRQSNRFGRLALHSSETGLVHFPTAAGEEVEISFSTSRLEPDGLRFSIGTTEPPANDDFSDAQDLGNNEGGRAGGISVLATSEVNEPPHGQGTESTSNHSLWWRWTPKSTDTYMVTTSSPLSVYQGTSLETLTEVAAGSGGLVFKGEAGIEYHIATASDSSDLFTTSININRFSQVALYPVDPSMATDLGSEEAVSFDQSVMSGPFTPISLRWTAPRDGFASFDLNQTTAEGIIESSLYHASSFVGTDRLGRTNFRVTASEHYFISLRGTAAFEATLRMEPATQPEPNSSTNPSPELAEVIDRELPYQVNWKGYADLQEESTGQWWRWQVPSTRAYALDAPYGTTVYRGESQETLLPFIQSDSHSGESKFFEAVEGEEIHFKIPNTNYDRSYNFRLSAPNIGIPTDNADTPIDLGSNEIVHYVSPIALILPIEADEDSPFTLRHTWLQWTAPKDGTLRMMSYHLDGTFVDELGNEDLSLPFQSSKHVERGEQVYIRMSSHSHHDFELLLHLRESVPAYDLWVESLAKQGVLFRETVDPLSDPDGDGLTNLQEMVFGSSPIRSNEISRSEQRYPWERTKPYEIDRDGYHFDISSAIQNGPDPITVLLETSTDLQTWTSMALDPGSYTMPREDGTSQLYYRIQVAE